jgi:hypothetical protein
MYKTIVFLVISGACALQFAAAQAPGSLRPDPTATLQASQPGTPVPPVLYRSSLSDLPRGVEQGETDWKTANANVGQYQRGHADLVQWEKDQARKNTAPSAGAKP